MVKVSLSHLGHARFFGTAAAARPMPNFFQKPLDKRVFMCYIILMRSTKKDFEFTAALLAAAIGGTPPLNLVQLASAKFAKDNPRFDEERFKEACGYYDECERLIKK